MLRSGRPLKPDLERIQLILTNLLNEDPKYSYSYHVHVRTWIEAHYNTPKRTNRDTLETLTSMGVHVSGCTRDGAPAICYQVETTKEGKLLKPLKLDILDKLEPTDPPVPPRSDDVIDVDISDDDDVGDDLRNRSSISPSVDDDDPVSIPEPAPVSAAPEPVTQQLRRSTRRHR